MDQPFSYPGPDPRSGLTGQYQCPSECGADDISSENIIQRKIGTMRVLRITRGPVRIKQKTKT